MKFQNKFFTLLVIGFLAVYSASPIAYARKKQSTSEITLQKAKQGDVKAQKALGFMYAAGKGVRQDYAEAIKWYRLAAAQGDAEGQCRLAQL